MENGKNIKHTSRHCGRGPAIQAVNKENNFHKRLDPGSMSGMTTQKAFTLVELLVVVLIIGVLSAIAIPMYQGAVDKSHWSTMLPGAKAIKDAEEAIRMTNGLYSADMEHLDVTMNNADLQFQLQTINHGDAANVVRVTNPKLANVRLASYLDENPVMGGQLHCEAKTGDERANRLCGKLLMGQYVMAQNGYDSYLLDEDIDKSTCDYAGQSWSSSHTKCYRTTQARCDALGMGVISGMEDQCGYTNTQNQTVGAEGRCQGNSAAGGCNGTVINDGGICQGNSTNSCNNTTINNGGTCLGSWDHGACFYATVNEGGTCIAETWDACRYNTVNAGGTCWAKGGSTIYTSYMFMCSGSTLNGGTCKADYGYTCTDLTVNDGGVCEANAGGTCTGTYNGTGCCKGKYCPSYAPKC